MAQAGQASGDLGRPVEGVLWMLTTTLAFVGVNGIVRHLGTELPAAQSAFIRFAFGLVFLAPAVWAMRRVALPAGIWPLFLWRGALHVAAVIFWFWAMARVPVAEMAAIENDGKPAPANNNKDQANNNKNNNENSNNNDNDHSSRL